ncbi:glycosyltransferase [Enterobacter ludwigii]|nr:glycosyltransferase [Enterobacter ludwigii]
MKSVPTIFISIASYRDAELYPTLCNLINEAEEPSRLHIAVCWQDDGDILPFLNAGLELTRHKIEDDHEYYQFSYRQARIDVISIHYFSSEGACWARYQVEKRYQQETYFLQIDSHCRFISNWDNEMIAMLESLRVHSKYPLLSSYPPGYEPGENEDRKQYVSRLTFNGFTEDGIVRLTSTPFKEDSPRRCGYLAAGFIFADGHFITTVPNDPKIFFMGEEISMAVRAWTHGYDIWSPNRILLWHYYMRKEHPKVWTDHSNDARNAGAVEKAWWERDKIAKARVLTVLGVHDATSELGCWGIGQERTLTEYQYRIGVNFKERSAHPAVTGEEKITWFEQLPLDHQQWLEDLRHINEKIIRFTPSEVDATRHDAEWWHVGIYCSQNTPLLVKKFTPSEMRSQIKNIDDKTIEIKIHFTTKIRVHPHSIRICPYLADIGWGQTLEKAW